jgi:uncharacterized membrane protein
MSATWKRDFASGLIVLVPLLVTVFVLTWLYNRIKQVPVGAQRIDFAPLRVVLTLVVFVLVVFAVGYLMRTALGSLVEAGIDDLMNRLPGLRVVYNASKMAIETAVGGTDELQTPVKVETWNGMRMTAFKTGQRAADGRDLLFLPTAPNITTGFVIEVDPDDYEELDESVEDALTRILSAGFGESNDEEISLDILVENEEDDQT